MKCFERFTSKMARTASVAVKEEVKNTAIDLLPTAIGIGAMILGVLIFKEHQAAISGEAHGFFPSLPSHSTITITTNNYYLGDESWKKY